MMQSIKLRTALFAAVATAATVLTAGSAHAADSNAAKSGSWCSAGKTVHFAGITWESGAFATEVLRQILEKGYGCKTDGRDGNRARA